MYHGGVVDGRKEPVNQVKLVFLQQDRPDGFDLHVSKRLSHAAMAAYERHRESNECIIIHNKLTLARSTTEC